MHSIASCDVSVPAQHACYACGPTARPWLHTCLSGPGPKVNSDITSDTPVDARAKGATGAEAATAAAEASSRAAAAVGGCGKVQVDFYGESLCPDCQVR